MDLNSALNERAEMVKTAILIIKKKKLISKYKQKNKEKLEKPMA